MSWALIRSSDNIWLSGPHDEAPVPGEGEHVVQIALGWPDTAEWSPSRGGFVDIVAPTTTITRLQFQRRFSLPERIAIRASSDPIVIDYREMGQLAEAIDLTDADVVQGVGYLEAQGLIGPGRAAEILTP